VTEYTGFGFHGITPTHAGSALGLYLLGGDTDDDALIRSRVQTGKLAWGTSLKKLLDKVFFGLLGEGGYTLFVTGEAEYEYEFAGTASGECRAKPGRGIRDNYLSFGMSNADGQAFQLDSIEVLTATSSTRRV
jgi:hypothetical protein